MGIQTTAAAADRGHVMNSVWRRIWQSIPPVRDEFLAGFEMGIDIGHRMGRRAADEDRRVIGLAAEMLKAGEEGRIADHDRLQMELETELDQLRKEVAAINEERERLDREE